MKHIKNLLLAAGLAGLAVACQPQAQKKSMPMKEDTAPCDSCDQCDDEAKSDMPAKTKSTKSASNANVDAASE